MKREYNLFPAGLSLVEVIIASSISIVVFALVILMLISNLHSFREVNRRIAVQQDAQLQMERIARELRQARDILQISESGGPEIYTKIRFSLYRSAESVAEIRYDYDTSRHCLIRKEAGMKDRQIARMLQTREDVNFIGYDEENNQADDTNEVRSVGIELVVTDKNGENTSSVRTRVQMRNRIDI